MDHASFHTRIPVPDCHYLIRARSIPGERSGIGDPSDDVCRASPSTTSPALTFLEPAYRARFCLQPPRSGLQPSIHNTPGSYTKTDTGYTADRSRMVLPTWRGVNITAGAKVACAVIRLCEVVCCSCFLLPNNNSPHWIDQNSELLEPWTSVLRISA